MTVMRHWLAISPDQNGWVILWEEAAATRAKRRKWEVRGPFMLESSTAPGGSSR